MKKMKRIIAILALALLIAAVAVTVVAETPAYTGKVTTMNKKIELIDSATELYDKELAIDDAIAYLAKIDPATEGYADFIAKIDSRELIFLDLYIDKILTDSTSEAKHKTFNSLLSWLAEHTIADTASFLVTDNGTPDIPEDDVYYTLASFYQELEVAKSSIAASYLADVIAAADAAAKHTALDNLSSFASQYAPAYTSDYTAEKVADESFACAKLYLAAISEDDGTAKYGAALRSLRGFVKDHPFPDTLDGYADFMSGLDSAKVAFDTAFIKAADALELKSHVGDFTKVPIVNRDFNEAVEGGISINNTGILTPEHNLNSDKTEHSYVGPDSGKDGNNGYYTVNYCKSGVHTRTNVTILSEITGSLVFECDITTFDYLPNSGIIFENGGVGNVPGKNLTRVYFRISPNGDLADKGGKVLVPGFVTPGEWAHLSLVFDQGTNYISIYADYELVASYSLAHEEGFTSPFERVRIGGTPSAPGGSYSMDNVKLYQGYAPRYRNDYSTYSQEQMFIYCTTQMTNSKSFGNDIIARVEYYKEATRLLGNFWDGMTYTTGNASVRAAVDAYLDFDGNGIESLISTLSDNNLEEFLLITDRLEKMEVSEDTYTYRTYFADAADAFVTNNSQYITKGAAFNDGLLVISDVREQLLKEDTVIEFNDAVSDFFSAATIADKQLRYSEATSLLSNIDISMAASGRFPLFTAAYERYLTMDDVLADDITLDNSKMIITCLKFIGEYDTEEKWAANYDYLRTYVVTARDLIVEGNYDPNYNNLGALVAGFAPMSNYFNSRIQAEHVAYITSELTRHDISDAYFEKYGILVKLNEYITENNVITDTAEMQALTARIATGLATLEANKEAYDALLVSNTAAFIERSKALLGAISYTEMKKICDEISVYYYAMNVTTAEAQDAIAVYSRRCEEIEAIEMNAAAFNLAVAVFDVPDTDVLETILEASKYLPLLEKSCDGVADSLKRYNDEITIFNAEAERGNKEMVAASEAAAALSNNGDRSSLVTLILSVLK